MNQVKFLQDSLYKFLLPEYLDPNIMHYIGNPYRADSSKLYLLLLKLLSSAIKVFMKNMELLWTSYSDHRIKFSPYLYKINRAS